MSHPSFRALDPDLDPSDVLICPKLETLVSHIDRKKGFNVQSITNVTAESRGVRLKFVQIEGRVEFVWMPVIRKTKKGRISRWFPVSFCALGCYQFSLFAILPV